MGKTFPPVILIWSGCGIAFGCGEFCLFAAKCRRHFTLRGERNRVIKHLKGCQHGAVVVFDEIEKACPDLHSGIVLPSPDN